MENDRKKQVLGVLRTDHEAVAHLRREPRVFTPGLQFNSIQRPEPVVRTGDEGR